MRATLLLLLAVAGFAQKTPDLSGVWLKGGGGGNNRNPVTQWTPEKLPFTKAGEAQLLANKSGKGPRQVPPALGNDPLGEANPPGLYRALIYNRPFELVQVQGRVLQVFEWSKTWRNIWADGRPVPEDVAAGPYWYGHSVGKWEGDTLVVETLALDERAWLDEWGTPFAADTRVTERWRRLAADKLELTITVNDPTTYAKPWTSAPQVFTLQKTVELGETIFAPMDEKEFNDRIRNPAVGKKK